MSPYICPHILSSLLVVCIQCPTVQALMWTFQYFSVAIFTCGELCVRLSMWPFHVSHVWLCGGRVGSVSISRSKCGFSVLSPPDRSLLSLPPSYPPLSSYHPAQPLHLHQPLHPPNPTSMIIWSTFTCNIFRLVCLQWASSIGVGYEAVWRLIGYLYLLAPVRQVALHCALLYSRLSLGLLVQGLAEMHLDRTQINEIYYPQIAVKGQRS